MKALKYILFSVFLLAGFSALASPIELVKDSVAVEAWDNSIVDYRCATVDTMDYFRGLPEYKYDLVKEPESLFMGILRWIASYLTVSDEGLSVLGWSLIILAALALLALVIRIARIPIKGLFVFSRSTEVAELKFGAENNNIDEMRLEKMLCSFIDNKAYREATRVLFLQTLRILNKQGLIRWNAFKTDREYYYELNSDAIRDEFLQLTMKYEFIWYGKFEIDHDDFVMVKENFDGFNASLTHKNGHS